MRKQKTLRARDRLLAERHFQMALHSLWHSSWVVELTLRRAVSRRAPSAAGDGDVCLCQCTHTRVLLNTDAISSGDDEDDTDSSEDFVSENRSNQSK